MSVQAMPLILAQYASMAGAFVYASPASKRTIVDLFVLRNNTGTGVTYAVYIVPAGGTADASNQLSGGTLGANTSLVPPELVLQMLGAGEKIYVSAGTASAVAIRASGRQITEET